MSLLSKDKRQSGQRQLLLVASLFIVPLAAAVLLYYSSAWRPVVNAQGSLIDPPRPISVIGLVLPDGRPVPADALLGHWSLVHPASRCDARTQARLDELQRVRLALDKDTSRVRRVLLHAGDCANFALPSLEADLLVLSASGAAAEAAFAQFPAALDGAHGIYIVDPHGNLMMSYPATGSARGLLKDLERLLRLSNIG
jgi:cytochrome oxidase Cu insertion factor (SCO1/SenC/PrrC family)